MANTVSFSTAPLGGPQIETRTTLSTAATDISTTSTGTAIDCWLDLISFTNVTTAAATVTMTANTSTAGFLTAVSIAANSTTVISLPGGQRFSGGVKWSANTSSAIVGYARGVRQAGTVLVP